MRHQAKKDKGSILVESLVAISVTSIGLVGIISLLTFSLRITRSSEQSLIASYLAAEGIEVVKNIIDTTYVDIGTAIKNGTAAPPWNRDISAGNFEVEFDSHSLRSGVLGIGVKSNRPLHYNSDSGSYYYPDSSESGASPTPFRRTVTIEIINDIDCDTSRDDAVRVISSVEWQTRTGDTEKVELEDHFFDWREESETIESRRPKTCVGV